MRTFFLEFGDVEDCVVMREKMSGSSRGFGFVVRFPAPPLTPLAPRPVCRVLYLLPSPFFALPFLSLFNAVQQTFKDQHTVEKVLRTSKQVSPLSCCLARTLLQSTSACFC